MYDYITHDSVLTVCSSVTFFLTETHPGRRSYSLMSLTKAITKLLLSDWWSERCVCLCVVGGVNRSSDWNKTKIPEADLSSALGWAIGSWLVKESGAGPLTAKSQMLPVNGDQCLIGLLSMTDDLSNSVLTPQTLDLPVAFRTQVKGVTPPEEGKQMER